MEPSTSCDHVTRGSRARFLRLGRCRKAPLDGTAVQRRNRRAGSPAVRPATPGDQEEPDRRHGWGGRRREAIILTSPQGSDGHWTWDHPRWGMTRGGSTILAKPGTTRSPPSPAHGISGGCLEGASPPNRTVKKGLREECQHQMELRQRRETQAADIPTNARHHLGKEEARGRKE